MVDSILSNLPPGCLVLVKDTALSSASFLLLHTLKNRFLAYSSSKLNTSHQQHHHQQQNAGDFTIFIALNDSYEHYGMVARKLGFNLGALSKSGRLAFLDLLSRPYHWKQPEQQRIFPEDLPHASTEPPPTPPIIEQVGMATSPAKQHPMRNQPGLSSLASQTAPMLKQSFSFPAQPPPAHQHNHQPPGFASSGGTCQLADLYRDIQRIVEARQLSHGGKRDEADMCIVIDDTSLLEVAVGGSVGDVLNFLQYCRGLGLGRGRCSMVLCVHADVADDRQLSLELALEHQADVVLDVRPLGSGHADDVHGQLTVTHRTGALGVFTGSSSKPSENSPSAMEGGGRRVPRKQHFQYRIHETSLHLIPHGLQ